MTQHERVVVEHCLDQIESNLTPGTVSHACLVMLRGILGTAHSAAVHAPRRGRKAKAAVEVDRVQGVVKEVRGTLPLRISEE
jgi:hypothetical protein